MTDDYDNTHDYDAKLYVLTRSRQATCTGGGFLAQTGLTLEPEPP
jgi:hypothetical protein